LCAGLAEWQTRSTQNALLERACGFESHIRHNGTGLDPLRHLEDLIRDQAVSLAVHRIGGIR
jgi:hypothetical protein